MSNYYLKVNNNPSKRTVPFPLLMVDEKKKKVCLDANDNKNEDDEVKHNGEEEEEHNGDGGDEDEDDDDYDDEGKSDPDDDDEEKIPPKPCYKTANVLAARGGPSPRLSFRQLRLKVDEYEKVTLRAVEEARQEFNFLLYRGKKAVAEAEQISKIVHNDGIMERCDPLFVAKLSRLSNVHIAHESNMLKAMVDLQKRFEDINVKQQKLEDTLVHQNWFVMDDINDIVNGRVCCCQHKNNKK